MEPLCRHALVRHAVEAAAGSVAEPVIVVTGYRAREIEAALDDLPVQAVHNTAFAEGLSTSLKAGFVALPSQTKAVVVVLGGMPFVTADLIDRLVHSWHLMNRPAALVPTMNGQRGNPVVLSRELEGLIERLSGDVGAGPILRGRSEVIECAIDDPAILQDVDIQEEFSRISRGL
jgi:molybdenum cofactor cytidylyltransferase